jgi:hypothetical protein
MHEKDTESQISDEASTFIVTCTKEEIEKAFSWLEKSNEHITTTDLSRRLLHSSETTFAFKPRLLSLSMTSSGRTFRYTTCASATSSYAKRSLSSMTNPLTPYEPRNRYRKIAD